MNSDFYMKVVGAYGGFPAVASCFVLVIAYFMLLMRREGRTEINPVALARKKSKRWIGKKARELEKDKRFRDSGDLYLMLGDQTQAAKMYIQGRALMKASNAFFEMGDFERAALALEKKGLFHDAAELYKKAQKPLKSAHCYEAAGETLTAAKTLEEEGEFLDAARAYEKEGFSRKAGEMYYRGGDKSRSLELLSDAIEVIAKRLPEYMAVEDSRMLSGLSRALGEMYVAEDKLEEASVSYGRGGHFALAGEIHEKLGQFDVAAELFRRAQKPFEAAINLDKIGDKKGASLLRAEAFDARGQLIEAVSNFEIAGDFKRAAEIYEKLGDYSKAARMHERSEADMKAGEMYLAAGEKDLAAQSFERGSEFKKAADIYGEIGNHAKQAEMLERAGEFLGAGETFYHRGMLEKAIRSLQRIEERHDDHKPALILLGDIFREKALPKLAFQNYRKALEGEKLSRKNIGPFYNMALALEAIGRLKEALEFYEQITALDFHYMDAPDRLKSLQKRIDAQGSQPSSSVDALSGTPSSYDATVIGQAQGSDRSIVTKPRERRYELLEEVGRGGMGIVYKARDTVLDRIVAYKILPSNLREHPQAIKNFFREAKSAAQLNHINIVTVHDAGEEDGNYYIAMEFLTGQTVKYILTHEGRLPIKTALVLSAQICKALAYAHDKKIVHRDVKNSNIMLTDEGTVKLMDFGLAKVIEEVKSSQTIASGTPYYMSPEQTLGKMLDSRTDLYSLGVTMFEMSTGTLPFKDGEAAYHHVHTPPPDPLTFQPDMPQELRDLILACMAKEPADRPQTAKHILDTIIKIGAEHGAPIKSD